MPLGVSSIVLPFIAVTSTGEKHCVQGKRRDRNELENTETAEVIQTAQKSEVKLSEEETVTAPSQGLKKTHKSITESNLYTEMSKRVCVL